MKRADRVAVSIVIERLAQRGPVTISVAESGWCSPPQQGYRVDFRQSAGYGKTVRDALTNVLGAP